MRDIRGTADKMSYVDLQCQNWNPLIIKKIKP